MTPEEMADLMARAYRHQTPWRAGDLASLAARPTTRIYTSGAGFLVAQVVADEAEILALAVDPGAQRGGLASSLLGGFHDDLMQGGIVRSVLDVAEDNGPARALYAAHGYRDTARRPRYYPRAGGDAMAAVLMSRAVTEGHARS